MKTIADLSRDLALGRTTTRALIEESLARIADPAGVAAEATRMQPPAAFQSGPRPAAAGPRPLGQGKGGSFRPKGGARPFLRRTPVSRLRREPVES